MNNRSRGFRIFLLSTSLTLGLTMDLTMAGCSQKHLGGTPTCGNHTVTIGAGSVTPMELAVCPGDSVTWTSNNPSITFQIHFDDPPLTAQQPTPTMPHPSRTIDFPSGATTTVGYDASLVWPDNPAGNCAVAAYQYCYKYNVSFNNGQPIDPHVIIVPPMN